MVPVSLKFNTFSRITGSILSSQKLNEGVSLFGLYFKPLSKLKRISKELSDKIDDLLINAESALYVDEALTGLNTERVRTDGNLPDIK